MTNRDSELSSFALYSGPIILGSVTANVMYAVVCSRARPFTGLLPVPLLPVIFAVIGTILIVRTKDRIVRAAFAVFTLYYALLALSLVIDVPFIDRLGYPSLFAFAALLTVAGSRANSQRAKLVVPIVFVAALILSWAARYYGDQLLGRQSVLAQVPFC